MTQSFSSPTEYLAYLQKLYAKTYPPGTADKEFERITSAELNRLNLSHSELGQFGGLHSAVEELTTELFASLDAQTVGRIAADVAVGILPTGTANAFIARSPNGRYAVLLCSGLMVLLHKYLKLVRAFNAPSDVVHCNRKIASALTKNDLSSYIVELVDIYRDCGVPYGPMIKLSETASADHSLLLRLAELFILCHELGHYLNGDLTDQSAYTALPYDAEGQKYEENRDHEIEYRADNTGFALYLRFLEARRFDVRSRELLKPILATFNLIFAIAGVGSSTHPHPYDRVRRIVEHHYGAELGLKINEALADPSLFPNIFAPRA